MLLVFVFNGMAAGFFGRRHVTIDLLDNAFGPRVTTVLIRSGDALSVLCLGLLFWAMLLPAGQAFVASNESDSGTLETKQVCKLLKDAGKGKGANIYVMEGILSNQSARQRTQDVHDVMATPDCNFIKIIDQQTANYQRDEAQSLMANWLTTGTKFDAVIANNDEMAIGALQAMKASGMDTKAVIVGGIDSTQDALASMKAGDLKVTVFQDAAGQGKGSVDAAVKLAKGDKVDKTVWIPFQLVTPETMSNFMKKN